MRGRGNARGVTAKLYIAGRLERLWREAEPLPLWRILWLALYQANEERRLTNANSEPLGLADMDDELLARMAEKCKPLFAIARAELPASDSQRPKLFEALKRVWIQRDTESLGQVIASLAPWSETIEQTPSDQEVFAALMAEGDRTMDEASIAGVEVPRLSTLQ